MFGVMQHLNVEICKDAEEAIAKGHVYREPTRPVEVTKVVVVQNGTEAGRSTVDFVLKDELGNEYVFMVTGALLKSIPC